MIYKSTDISNGVALSQCSGSSLLFYIRYYVKIEIYLLRNVHYKSTNSSWEKLFFSMKCSNVNLMLKRFESVQLRNAPINFQISACSPFTLYSVRSTLLSGCLYRIHCLSLTSLSMRLNRFCCLPFPWP